MMSDDIKQTLIFVGGFLVFFGLMFGVSMYSDNIRHECRLKAIEKGLNASEIQVVCRS
jgi:hypothetical protein